MMAVIIGDARIVIKSERMSRIFPNESTESVRKTWIELLVPQINRSDKLLYILIDNFYFYHHSGCFDTI